VILSTQLIGDIIFDQASVIGGSIGFLFTFLHHGEWLFHVWPNSHGLYPQAAGKDIANPQ